jgi:hypothetical protein
MESLKEKIDKLDTNEHKQIYAIIKRFNPTVQVTKTQQGVLVTANTLNAETITEIQRYVSFCIDQRKRMDDDMKTRKEYERMI